MCRPSQKVWQHFDCMRLETEVEHYSCEQCEPRPLDRVGGLTSLLPINHYLTRCYLTLDNFHIIMTSSSSLNFCFFIWIFHLDPSAPGSNALSDWLAGSTNAAPAQLCPVRLDVLHLLAPRRAAAAPRYGGPVVSHAHRADSAICLLWSHLAGSLELVGVRDRARRCPQQDWGHNIWTLNPDPPTLTL